MKIDFDVQTEINNGDIETKIDLMMEDVVIQTMHSVVKTRDDQIRAGLIELGWTPPAS